MLGDWREIADGLLENGEKSLRRELKRRKFTDSEADRLVRHVRDMDFLPLVAFAASSTRLREIARDEIVNEAAGRIAASQRLRDAGVDEETVRRAILAAVQPGPPDVEDVLRDEKLRRIVLEAVAKEVAERASIPAAEAFAAGELLLNGGLFVDLAGVAAAVARTLRRVPSTLVGVAKAPLALPAIAVAIVRDIAEVPGDAVVTTKGFLRLLQGEDDPWHGPFPPMDKTFRALVDQAPAKTVRQLAVELLAIESVRLAAIVYARTRGVKLEAADLDAVAGSLKSGDLTPLIVRSAEALKKQYGAGWTAKLRELFPYS